MKTPAPVLVETAVELPELIREATFILEDPMGRGSPLECDDPFEARNAEYLSFIRDLAFAQKLAYAVWVPQAVSSEVFARIQRLLAESPLTLTRDPYAGVRARTEGATSSELREQIDRERRTFSPLYGDSNPVGRDVFRIMLREAAVDYVVRSADSDYELRRCVWCAEWFEPVLKARGRFCSEGCRKEFNNLRARDDQFHCSLCESSRPLDEFSGLCKANDEHKRLDFLDLEPMSTPLRLCGLRPDTNSSAWNPDQQFCCAPCVRTSFPAWKRYLASMRVSKARPGASK